MINISTLSGLLFLKLVPSLLCHVTHQFIAYFIRHDFICKGADLNVKDNSNKTAYNWAEINGHQNIMDLLQKAGASPVGNGKGNNALPMNRSTSSLLNNFINKIILNF
jgi:ankyrin repeat protein